MGRGWMPTDFPDRTAHKRYLDAVFPDRPVLIRDRDGHQALANSRALALAGVTRDTADPDDGRIEREADGEPTGLLKEGAAGLVTHLLPTLSAADTYQLLLEELAAAASFGLTSLTDATSSGLTDNERAAVERALAEGRLTVNYRAALPLETDVTAERLAGFVRLRDATGGQLLTYGFAKGMIDGTVDAKTAVMLQPYVDGGNGTPFVAQDELNRTVAAYDRAGLQVGLHAIGDGAIRMALDAYAGFEETRTGTISAGRFADFVVLSRDILDGPPQQLLQTKVLLTVLRGRETWRAPEFSAHRKP
jgi:predicted amidohydrolase YtcJ